MKRGQEEYLNFSRQVALRELTQKRDVIERNGRAYVVSTLQTIDYGWETMIFELIREDDFIRLGESIYEDHYVSEREAYASHDWLVKNWEVEYERRER